MKDHESNIRSLKPALENVSLDYNITKTKNERIRICY